MSASPPQETWQALAEALSANASPVGLECKTPPGSWCSLLDALDRPELAASHGQATEAQRLHRQLTDLLGRLSSMHQLSRCPVIAITGMLNSGKSSLLATYLSPTGRARVLRGLDNASGTHRYVLWLPSKWRQDTEMLESMFVYLRELFGHAPEPLSESPDEAALQYSGVLRTTPPNAAALDGKTDSQAAAPSDASPFETPLVAFDDGLDALQIGLVDCPDIQTGFALQHSTRTGVQLAADRQAHLSAMGRLCSAFIVVCKLSSLHDDGLQQVLTTLRDAMPGVPRWLAINKVKSRYAPSVVAQQARGLEDRFGLQCTYVAYDYRSALAHSRIPPTPPQLSANTDDSPQPIFFAAYPEDPQPTELKYLHSIGDQLDIGALARESSRSLAMQIKVQATQACAWLAENTRLQSAKTESAWKSVADACYDFMAQRGPDGTIDGLRLQASPAIVAQLTDSLGRTAPIWMRLSLKIDRTARQLHQAISNSAARFKILGSASKSVAQLAERFKRGDGAQVVTPHRLADAIRHADHSAALESVSDDDLIHSCDLAMRRFAEEDAATLDAEQLDAWSRQVWKGMSMKEKLWKSTQPLALVMAPFLAVILIPIDAGGTSVLVFASMKELLAAAGLAAVLGPTGTGRETLGIAQRETPWRQLADLFAICCDQLGLPRPAERAMPELQFMGGDRRLALSQVKQQIDSSRSPAIPVWEASEALQQQLATALHRISS